MSDRKQSEMLLNGGQAAIKDAPELLADNARGSTGGGQAAARNISDLRPNSGHARS